MKLLLPKKISGIKRIKFLKDSNPSPIETGLNIINSNLFVGNWFSATNNSDIFVAPNDTRDVAYSLDGGITWNGGRTGLTAGAYYTNAAFGNGKFFIGTRYSTPKVAVSVDAINWTEYNVGFSISPAYMIYYNYNGTNYLNIIQPNRSYISTDDGATFAPGNSYSGIPAGGLASRGYYKSTNTTLVIEWYKFSDNTSGVVYTTNNGSSYTNVNFGTGQRSLYFCNNTFISWEYNTKNYKTSSDGITWTNRTASVPNLNTGQNYEAFVSNTYFCIVLRNGSIANGTIYYTSDFSNWSSISVPAGFTYPMAFYTAPADRFNNSTRGIIPVSENKTLLWLY